MGDNMSWWEHMIVNIRMLQSLNMCGYFYTGADIGGFGCNASPELVIRWMQLGIFSPLYRNHSAWGTRNQEPWAFDEDTENIMKNTLKIRYSLITYAYSEYMKSVKNSKTFITPLFMEYNTARAKETEDQFLYGDSIMVTPIYIQNAKGRYVHLPEDKWLFCLMKSNEEKQAKIYESGDHYINVEMEEIPFFIKENSLVPFNESMNYVGEKEITEITVLGFVTDKAFYEIYDDEGTDTKYAENYSKLKIEVRKKDEEFLFSVNKEDFGDYESKIKIIHFEIYDEKNILHTHKIEI
jgi:alpha-glucosidase